MIGEPVFRERFTAFARQHRDSVRANGYKAVSFFLRRRLLTHLLNRLAFSGQSPLAVLDCGCGNGYLAGIYQQYLDIRKLDGIDFTDELAKLAREGGRYDNVVVGNVLDLDGFFPGLYDLIISCEVYQYISPEKRSRFWSQHMARLAPNGRMILLAPNLASGFRKIKKFKYGYYLDLPGLEKALAESPTHRILESWVVDMFTGLSLRVDGRLLAGLKSLLGFEIGLIIGPRD